MTRVANNRIVYTSSVLAVLVLFIFFAPFIVAAQGYISLVGIDGARTAAGFDTQEYIDTLYRIAIIAAAFVAVGKLVWAGAQYVLSGVVTKKEDAKKDIWGALIGILIILGAVTILTTINPQISNLRALNPIDVPPPPVPDEGNSGDASGVEAERQRCEARADEGYVFIVHSGTWDNPVDGVECCKPNTSGADACRNTTGGIVGDGIEIINGRTYSAEEYDALIAALETDGLIFTHQTALLMDVESTKQDCEADGGVAFDVKRSRGAGISAEIRVICVIGES